MGIRKDHKNVKMKKSRLIIAAVVAALATGCFLNSVFAQESTHHAETSRTEKLNDMKLGAGNSKVGGGVSKENRRFRRAEKEYLAEGFCGGVAKPRRGDIYQRWV